MVVAKFEHDAARPDKISGYAAPQLHTHALAFNVTETADGRNRAVQPLELFRSQKYATSIYRTHLAEVLQRLGYKVKVDKRTGAPEIKGFSPDYVKENSPRSSERKSAARAIKARLELGGADVKEGAGLMQAARAARARNMTTERCTRA
jgi:conjugative relaxase-like TrwC/TraI family protein